jgi:hypothetical protein
VARTEDSEQLAEAACHSGQRQSAEDADQAGHDRKPAADAEESDERTDGNDHGEHAPSMASGLVRVEPGHHGLARPGPLAGAPSHGPRVEAGIQQLVSHDPAPVAARTDDVDPLVAGKFPQPRGS